MKKIYVFYLLFTGFLFSQSGFGQFTKAEAVYNVEVHRKGDKQDSAKTGSSGRVDLIFREVENIRILFSYNNGKASFKAEEDHDLDYMTSLNRRSAKTIAGVRDGYYYNIPKKEVVTDRELWGTRYNIVYNLDHYTWKLHDVTKTIHNYQCYKATSKKTVKDRMGKISTLNITAWYAPQIPIPLGPKNYTGLPGLVLELYEDTRRTYHISKLALNPEKEIIIAAPAKGKAITETEFEKIAAQAYSNYMGARKNK